MPGVEVTELDATELAPGQKATATGTYTLTQADIDAGSLENTVKVTGKDPTGEEVTDEDDETVTIEANPSLEVVKTADIKDISEAKAGDTITYTFAVVNNGNVTIDNIVLEDVLPGVEVGDLNKTTLAPGQTAFATGTYKLTQTDIDAGKVDNTVKATGKDPNGNEVTDEDDETVTTTSIPGIELVKSAESDHLENAHAGETITYTFTVTNTGNYTLNNIKVNDPLLGGEVTLNETVLAPGASTSTSATYTLTQADIDAGKVDNVASVEGTDPTGTTSTDEDDQTVTIQSNPAIKLVKSANPGTLTGAKAGDQVTYTFTVTNTGTVTLDNIAVSDPLISEIITLEKTTLAPNETTSGQGVYTLTQADIDAGKVDNTAKVTGDSPEGDDGSSTTVENEDSTTITVTGIPAITLEKTAEPKSITDGKVGDEVTYTFKVTNVGTYTLHDVKVVDPMIDGEITLDVTTLAPNESATGTATYVLTQADVDAGVVENTATAEGTDPVDEKVDAQDTELVNITSTSSIKIEKVANVTNIEGAKTGDAITYTFTVTNTGNTTLTGIAVDDPLIGEAIALDKTTLAPGEATTGIATYTLTQADIDANKVDNTAIATGKTPGGQDVDSDDTTTVETAAESGIKLEKTVDMDVVEDGKAGDVLTYTFTVTNIGTYTLNDVKIADELNGVSIASLDKTTLAPGESATAIGTYTLTQADIDAFGVTNTAKATGTDPNGNDVTDEDTVVSTITAKSALTLEKVVDKQNITDAKPGDILTYTFTVTNTGALTLTNVAVSDALEGLVMGEIDKTTLAPGEKAVATATYALTQKDIESGSVVNGARASATDPRGENFVDEDEVTTIVTAEKEEPGKDGDSKTPQTPGKIGSNQPDKKTLAQTSDTPFAMVVSVVALVSAAALVRLRRMA